MRTKHRKRKDKKLLISYMVYQNKIFKIKLQAKNIFPRDVERTVHVVELRVSFGTHLKKQERWEYIRTTNASYARRAKNIGNRRIALERSVGNLLRGLNQFFFFSGETSPLILMQLQIANICTVPIEVPLRKHAYSNILKISPPKTKSSQIKYLIFFIFLRGGSNEYSQYMFLSRNKKMYTPVNSSFTNIKLGLMGVKII